MAPETWKNAYADGRVLLIDKPLQWTSFDVVKKIRIAVGISKVGHAGTLDPLATGLLIVCTGRYTKQINTYMAQEKEYTATFTLGAQTPTYDLESSPVDAKPYAHLTEADILSAVSRFTGEILQVPPAHSAIKKDGVPAYVKARKGQDVVMEPRRINIYSFDVTRIELPEVDVRIVCSTGTYIRSLAHDLGQALGCGGYLSKLRRTRIGSFPVCEAQSIEGFLETLQEEKRAAAGQNG